MAKSRLVPSLAVALAVASGGRSKTLVEIISKPQGASIYIDGERQGITPMPKVLLPFRGDPTQRVFIQLVKPGYRPTFTPLKLIEIPDENKISVLLEEI